MSSGKSSRTTQPSTSPSPTGECYIVYVDLLDDADPCDIVWFISKIPLSNEIQSEMLLVEKSEPCLDDNGEFLGAGDVLLDDDCELDDGDKLLS